MAAPNTARATDADNNTSLKLNFFVSFPFPKIFTLGILPFDRLISFALRSVSGLTISPSPNFFSTSSTVTVTGCKRNDLKRYPRSFGIFFKISRSAGRIFAPARDFCPLMPLPENVPRFPPRPILRDFRICAVRVS